MIGSKEQIDQLNLESLLAYDESIAERADEIRLGLHPNGHSPNGALSAAIGPDATTITEAALINEYYWALAVASYPHREQEPKAGLMEAASDALFKAGESYDTTVEPNFLTHFSVISRSVLQETFGEPTAQDGCPVDHFDDLVIADHLEPLPPLATARQPEHFEPGDHVLVLSEHRLLDATIRAVKRYTHSFTANPLPDTEAQKLQDQLEAMTADGYDWQVALSKVGLRHKGGTPDAKALHLLGLLRHPDQPQIVQQRAPGFLHLSMSESPFALITDIGNNYVIPNDAWDHIKCDPLYRKAWLETGSPESLRQQADLQRAFDTYIP